MGYSEVGGNGSVEWEVASEHGGRGDRSSDPIDFPEIGRAKGKDQHFRVEMRFDTLTTAGANAIIAAFGAQGIDARIGGPKNQGVVLWVFVPAIRHQPLPGNKWSDPPFEARIEW